MKRRRSVVLAGVLAGMLGLSGGSVIARGQTGGAASLAQTTGRAPSANSAPIQHVLLLSVDGLHATDLTRYVTTHPNSALASLTGMGVAYPNASTSEPSDSFPGLLSMVTGGSPRTTGVYYDDSYDRSLSPPGSDCSTRGTEVVYDESIDISPTLLDGGGGIDPAKLPRDPAKGCAPVYPHSFLRVNTIFEAIKATGRRTAWSDKHPAYDLVNGPSGKGVDDLYNPEIAATSGGNGRNLYGNADDTGTTNVTDTAQYDSLKVRAVLNEIDGEGSITPTQQVGVPAIFGMNFQAVSVGEKVPTGGYADAAGAPAGDLVTALDFVDQSIGAMVHELTVRGLLTSTAIIVTAKHGQTPIGRNTLRKIGNQVDPIVNGVQPKLVAQSTRDDVDLLWLSDQSKTGAAVAALTNTQSMSNPALIQQVLAGDALKAQFGDPATDPRVPDIIVLPQPGVIYTQPNAAKIAEHGGFNHDDTNVALLVSNPLFKEAGTTNSAPVETTQIAPTILSLLGVDPAALQAVRLEGTGLLPGLTVSLAQPLGGEALTAALLPGNQVPPVTNAPAAQGLASVSVDPLHNQVCYTVTVSGLTGPAIELHIHEGAAGTNGPVRVPFVPPATAVGGPAGPPYGGTTNGCVPNVDHALIRAIIANPAGYYVNLHTTTNPMGEIRGQLSLPASVAGGGTATLVAGTTTPVTSTTTPAPGTATTVATGSPTAPATATTVATGSPTAPATGTATTVATGTATTVATGTSATPTQVSTVAPTPPTGIAPCQLIVLPIFNQVARGGDQVVLFEAAPGSPLTATVSTRAGYPRVATLYTTDADDGVDLAGTSVARGYRYSFKADSSGIALLVFGIPPAAPLGTVPVRVSAREPCGTFRTTATFQVTTQGTKDALTAGASARVARNGANVTLRVTVPAPGTYKLPTVARRHAGAVQVNTVTRGGVVTRSLVMTYHKR